MKAAQVGGWAPDLDLTDKRLDTLFGPFRWAPQTRGPLRRLLNEQTEGLASWRASVSPGPVRKKLKEGEKAVKALRAWFNTVAGAEEGVEGAARNFLGDEMTEFSDFNFRVARRDLMLCEITIARALKKLPRGKRGNPDDNRRGPFLLALHALYRQSGGKQKISRRYSAGAGEFFDITRAALMLVEGKSPTPRTVVRTLEEVFYPPKTAKKS